MAQTIETIRRRYLTPWPDDVLDPKPALWDAVTSDVKQLLTEIDALRGQLAELEQGERELTF